jgi:predicted dehydrogenase
MATHQITRRGFVGAMGVTAGSAALLGATTASRAAAGAANDKVRLGLIGAGSRGNQVLRTFLENDGVDFPYVVDIDDQHASETAETIEKKRGLRPKTSREYREMLDDKDIDAVVIATPDHWHALPSIHAVMAGKDVYVEKPIGHNVAEGQAMIRAARKYDKIMAVGTQQRSAAHFQKAVDAVRSGKIGKVFWVQTWNVENISPVGMGIYPDTTPPRHVDYDRWLGPAPARPFNINRFHLLFRWYFDYAGGMMSDWGVHLNDIVLWALDAKAPQAIYATGGIFTTSDDRDTPDTLQVIYEFPGCTLTYSMRKGNGLKYNGHGYGILFCGTDGSLMLDREGYEIIPDKTTVPYGIAGIHPDLKPRKIELEAEKEKGIDGQSAHIKNFLQCLSTRERPICDIEIGHRSTNTCHLGNIAYRLGRKLIWDGENETFKGDREANALLAREPRRGFELPNV